MRRAVMRSALCLSALVAACSSGGTEEGGVLRGAIAPDAGNTSECAPGEHDCDGTCVSDGDNDPAVGCALGCGTPCPGPASGEGTATCGEDGTCALACNAGFAPLGGDCLCEGALTCEALGRQCGTTDDGCGGTLDCGGCADGSPCGADGTCGGCDPDDAEPNDAEGMAFDLGAFTDSPKSNQEWKIFGLGEELDADWYVATIKDKLGLNAGNPDVRVTVAGLGKSDDYEIAAWYVCDAGAGSGGALTCDEGEPDEGGGKACVASSAGGSSATVKFSTKCNGSNESGTVSVRIRALAPPSGCAPYTLTLTVD